MKVKVTDRQIAKILVHGLPLDDEELAGKVEEYIHIIDSMPQNTRLALKSAYIFSSKVPKEEREDMFQELATAILENGTDSETLAYRIAQNDFRDWIEKRETHKRHLAGSLNEVKADKDGHEVELIDTLVGEANFEDKAIAKLEAQRLYRKLPYDIKLIVKKLYRGDKLLRKERDKIYEYRENYLRHKENKPQTILPNDIKQIIEKQGRLTSTERSRLFRYRRKYGDIIRPS